MWKYTTILDIIHYDLNIFIFFLLVNQLDHIMDVQAVKNAEISIW